MNIRKLCAASLAALALDAVAGTITTFAGGGSGVNPTPPSQLATEAVLNAPRSIVVDAAGDFHFSQGTDGGTGPSSQKRIDKVSGGILSTRVQAAGGVSAMAIDAAGNIYYTDAASHQVKKLDLANAVTVVAGTGSAGYGGDGGPAASAQLSSPEGIAVVGSDLLVSDTGNHRIRRISGGTITTVAGTGVSGYDGDGGPATSAKISRPTGIVGDGAGGFYFVHPSPTPGPGSPTGAVRHVDSGGVIRTRSPANIAAPGAMARDPAGLVYVAGGILTHVVFRVDVGALVVVAGNYGPFYSGDGVPATSTTVFQPYGIAFNAAGEMFIADTSNNRIRKVNTAGIISTVAGGGSSPPPYIGDGGPATSAVFISPAGVSVDVAGNVLVSDSGAHRVRRIDASGTITTLAGTGTSGFSGDGGPAASANLFVPMDVIASGITTYIADDFNRRIRRVDNTGTIATVAGVGPSGSAPANSSGDGGPATAARLSGARSLAMDSAGQLLVADLGRVRRITTSGVIDTIAGDGTISYPGDGGLATRAGIVPSGLAFDAAGNLYISDGPNHAVRKVDTAGVMTTVAGDGTDGYSGDGGPATAARLGQPLGLAFDPSGNLYIVDGLQHRVRKVSPDGVISTIAGTGAPGFSGDGGDSTAAALSSPSRVAWHAPSSSLLVSDGGNRRVRRIAIADDTPAPFQFAAQSGVAPSAALQSNTVTPTGFDVAAPISITGGEYSVGCTGTFTASPGTFAPGQAVCVRHTASSLNNAFTTTALTIGGVRGAFVSTTLAGPGSFTAAPASLDFGEQWVYTSAVARPVTVTNTGATPLAIHSIGTAAPYLLTHDCPATLAAGATCSLQVGFRPLVAGASSAAITIQASSGTQSVALAGVGSQSLTAHYYQSILGRAPDAPGRAFWDAEAERIRAAGANVNEVWFALAMQFFTSAEYTGLARSDSGFVTDLYRAFFNRAPDAPGLAFWTGQLSQGMPREVLLAQFMFSTEFTLFTNNIFGTRSVRAEVDMVMDFYRGLLGRLPDTPGLQGWVQGFRADQCDIAPYNSVYRRVSLTAYQFIGGAEYTGRNRTDAQFVGDLYNAFMRRGGDLQGVQYWIGRLTSGALTRQGLVEAFVASREFGSRITRVASEPCLPP